MSRRKIGVAAALVAAAMMTGAPAMALTVGPDCKTANTYFQTSTDSGQTNSASFTQVPNGFFAINTKKTGCIIVNFVADTYIYPSDTIVVEAVLDSNVMDPGPLAFDDGDNNIGASHVATWAASNVAPGIHNLFIYWKVQGGSTTASMGYSTTTFTYSK